MKNENYSNLQSSINATFGVSNSIDFDALDAMRQEASKAKHAIISEMKELMGEEKYAEYHKAICARGEAKLRKFFNQVSCNGRWNTFGCANAPKNDQRYWFSLHLARERADKLWTSCDVVIDTIRNVKHA